MKYFIVNKKQKNNMADTAILEYALGATGSSAVLGIMGYVLYKVFSQSKCTIRCKCMQIDWRGDENELPPSIVIVRSTHNDTSQGIDLGEITRRHRAQPVQAIGPSIPQDYSIQWRRFASLLKEREKRNEKKRKTVKTWIQF